MSTEAIDRLPPDTTDFHYVGSELALFEHAVNWKSYLKDVLRPYLGANVLEVGAGSGTTTAYLCSPSARRWVCLEPDETLAVEIRQAILTGKLPPTCSARVGFLDDLDPAEQKFDSVLYIDVLEHIERDREELAKAAKFLAAGGWIVVLAPAHQGLFSPFDAAIGHFRRYSKDMLLRLAPPGARIADLRYLDSVGLVASGGNRMLLRQSQPTRRQIKLWDRCLVPLSRRLDPLLGYRFGKSVLAVWHREI